MGEREAEIRARLAAIPKPPWFWSALGEHGYPQRVLCNDDGLNLICEIFYGDLDGPNPIAELIANALADLAYLLDRLSAAERVCAAAQAVRGAKGDEGFGGYSPHECTFCRVYLYDVADGSADHDEDCEFRALRDALDAWREARGD